MTRLERRDRVIELLRSGMSDTDVADAVGRSRGSVQQIRSRYLPDMTRERRNIDVAPKTAADLEWTEQAVCASVDPELFFPEKGGTTAPAKRVCRGCPVTTECLEWALTAHMHFGIWGGLSERERRKLEPGVA